MNLSSLMGRISRSVSNNSPAILTGVGVAGVLTTAFLTAKATFKASVLISDEERKDAYEERLDPKEKFNLVWKLYIPPAVACFATVTAIICSNRIEYRRAAAVAAAYAISERGWEEYKAKIVEKLGPKKEQQARDEQAQDEVNRNPPSGTVIIEGDNDVLCLDRWSGRYFRSTMEKIKEAQIDTMYQVLRQDFASLSCFYDRIGLDPTTESDDIGWNTDTPLELVFSHALDKQNKPCLTFTFRTTPFRY